MIGLNLAKVQFDRKIEMASAEIAQELSTRNQLTFLVGRSLQKDDKFFTVSLDSVERASNEFLNEFINDKLLANDLEMDFSYALRSRDTVYVGNTNMNANAGEHLAIYPVKLYGYLPELTGKTLVLELKFNQLDSFFLAKLNGLTLPSLLFILGILATIIWVLRTYYWQRNIITTTNEFINNLTHELKTPVFSIALATKILDKNASDEQQSIIAIIRQQTSRLTEHIDKVLEIGSMEGKKKVFNLERVDFRPYLQALCQEFEMLAPLENVVFSYSLEPGRYELDTEVFHLENAINNLLDNAKKYAKQPQIYLEAKKVDKKLVIAVHDNGSGIAKKDQRRVFEKYYRATNGDLHEVKGYGLGLNYVKHVVEHLKGKVYIESEKDKGSVVYLSIPLCHDR